MPIGGFPWLTSNIVILMHAQSVNRLAKYSGTITNLAKTKMETRPADLLSMCIIGRSVFAITKHANFLLESLCAQDTAQLESTENPVFAGFFVIFIQLYFHERLSFFVLI
jgi:hypothetical protein